MKILRTKKAVMRAMYEVKMSEKRKQKLIKLLGLKYTLDGLARASGVQWYGHVLTRDSGDVLRRALNFEVARRRGHGRPNMTMEETSGEAYQSNWTEKAGCH